MIGFNFFRLSLFTRVMLWFFLNLLLLAVIFLLLFNFETRSPVIGSFGSQIDKISAQISDEISRREKPERDEIIARYTQNYAVEFFVFDYQGAQIAGREIVLPPEIKAEITRSENNAPPRGSRENLPPSREPRGNRPPPPRPVFYRTTSPTLYWNVARSMFSAPQREESVRIRILAASDSLTGNGLYFDLTPWIILGAIVVGVSTLFWLPFVGGITRAVKQMNAAAALLADENFDVRVSEKRTDELGNLGKSINHLAARLSGYVNGQKRFLGDISHELNSPLARMQFALTILEDRVDDDNRAYVVDVKEEVELMSKLVSELLAFSKAGIQAAKTELETVALLPLAAEAVARERENADVDVKIAADLEVLAHPELLSRALSNIVRNAVRYAGHAGKIEVAAQTFGGQTQITVCDHGAGVPEAEIEKLFDPFYRVQSDRARQTGGTGLGLAIVKTCVEACQGKVTARNRRPQGLEVIITLKAV